MKLSCSEAPYWMQVHISSVPYLQKIPLPPTERLLGTSQPSSLVRKQILDRKELPSMPSQGNSGFADAWYITHIIRMTSISAKLSSNYHLWLLLQHNLWGLPKSSYADGNEWPNCILLKKPIWYQSYWGSNWSHCWDPCNVSVGCPNTWTYFVQIQFTDLNPVHYYCIW